MEAAAEARLRFQLELEFVQALASPVYLNHLAQSGYLKDPRFVAYLAYLRYWKEPQYAVFVRYPVCLAMLDLLQDARVRAAVGRDDVMRLFHMQQFFHWRQHGISLPSALPHAAAAAVPVKTDEPS